MMEFQIFYDTDGCFLVVEQAVCCGQCGAAHYLFRNVGGKTICLECAGPIVDTMAKLKKSIEFSDWARELEATSLTLAQCEEGWMRERQRASRNVR